MKQRIARLFLIPAALATLIAAAPARADYPEGPITLLVGWNAGGGTDLLARYIADAVSRQTGAEIVVENRPGAGGIIGTEMLANAEPDGQTLMMGTSDSLTIAPLLRSSTGYTVPDDFDPVYLVATLSFIMVSRPGLEFDGAGDISKMAGSGDGLTVGTWGVGSTAHIAAEMFNISQDVELVHVPYQGSAPAINDLQNDQIDIMFLGPGTTRQNVSDGLMQVVGVTGPDRLSAVPDFPTLAEQGVDGVGMRSWYGIVGPDGLPEEVTDWWTAQLEAIIGDPDFLSFLDTRGMDASGLDSDTFSAFMAEQSTALATAIETAGITVE